VKTEQLESQTKSTVPEPTQPRHGGGTLLLWLLALPVLYILSMGPTAKINTAYILPRNQNAIERGLDAIYWPVDWCALHCRPFRLFLHWYLGDVWHVPEMG
jgi:hypothetical protein